MTTPDPSTLKMMPRAAVEALRSALVLDVDQAWFNHFGEHVWLGPLYRDGTLIGITDCCDYDVPCARHARLTEPRP